MFECLTFLTVGFIYQLIGNGVFLLNLYNVQCTTYVVHVRV